MSLGDTPQDLPDDPRAFMKELGVERGDASGGPALAAMRAKIAGDLEARQGPHRKRGLVARMWPVAAAAAFLLGAFLVLKPAASMGGLYFLAAGIAAVAGLICLIATGLATERPALSERIALVGILGAGAAIGIEGYLAATCPSMGTDTGLKCGAMTLAVSAVPLALLLVAIKRSGFPLRRVHAAALGAAGIALAGASVWFHCPSEEGLHLMAGHIALPAIVAGVVGAVVFRAFTKLNAPQI